MSKIIRLSYKRASAKLVLWGDSQANLSNVFSVERGKGHATGLMRIVERYGDENNVTIYLVPKQYGYADKMSPNNAGLRRFYAKFGFVSTDDGWMRRVPRKLHGP